MTKQELQQNIQAEIKDVIVSTTQAIKKYVDGRDEVLKSELIDEITKQLSGVKGLNEDLSKLQKMAEAFAKVFDENKDGKITADEIVAKLALIQSNIDKVAADLANTNANVENLQKALNKLAGEIDGKIAGAKEEIKAYVSDNYFTKVEVNDALKINKDEILKEVNAVLFGNDKDNQGDGATL